MRQIKIGPVLVEDYLVTTVYRSPGSERTFLMEENWYQWKQSYSFDEVGVVRMSLCEISHMDFRGLTETRIKTRFKNNEQGVVYWA